MNAMASSIQRISQTKIGTHCLQMIIALIQKSKKEEQIIIKNISSNLKELCEQQQSRFFIQKVIKCFSDVSVDKIYDILKEDLLELSQHKQGVTIVKQLMKRFQNNEEKRKDFLYLISFNLETLV